MNWKQKIIVGFSLLCSSLYATGVIIESGTARNGASLVRFINNTPVTVYCHVIHDNGYGYFDFYVQPYSASRWHYEPEGYYEWRCK